MDALEIYLLRRKTWTHTVDRSCIFHCILVQSMLKLNAIP